MWNNKVAIITGSSMGIGRALAIEICKKGGKVVLNGRNKQRLDSAYEDLSAQGFETIACAADISNYSDCEALVKSAIDKYGAIDVLINNAGIASSASLEESKPEVFKQVMDVNFLGAVNMTKAALSYLKLTKGDILFVGSIASIHGIGDYSAYCCSKSAIRTLVESLRIELFNTGIYVGYANVGFTQNDPDKTFLDKNGDAVGVPARGQIKQTPVKKVGAQLVKMIEEKRAFRTFTSIGKLNEIISRISPSIVHKVLLRSYLKERS